jgi:hypothetical protein
MIYGRIILIHTTYFNKIVDIDTYSYFVALNRIAQPFIKIKTIYLDKKMYNYQPNVIEETANTLIKLLDLDTILSYTPFVRGTDNQKKSYYKKKKQILKIEQKSGTINFD